MTLSDPITEQLSAVNPVPSVAFLVPTVNDANEFLAVVKGLDLADDATPPTGLLKNGVGPEAPAAPREVEAVECRDDPLIDHLRLPADRISWVAESDDLTVEYFEPRFDDGDGSGEQRGWLGVAVAVAAAILVVVGGVVVADANDGDIVTEPATLPVATDPPVSSPDVEDSVPSSEGSGVTDSQSIFGGPGRQGMFSVTVGGPGLVAVGGDSSASNSGGMGSAAVWTSVDGLAWSRVPHDEAMFGTGGAVMHDVTVGGPGLVAVGAEGDSFSESESEPDAVVWTSVDGLTWSRVPHDEAVFGGGWMDSVTAGGPGLVAVGSVDSAPQPDDEVVGDAAVWTSVDGITWSRVPHDEAVFGGAGAQRMDEVIVGGPGLVAVGSDGKGWWDWAIGGLAAAVWTSPDGITWSRVPHDEAVFGRLDEEADGADGSAMISVTAGGPGLVAVGIGGSDVPLWTSVDGITWSRVTDHNVSDSGAIIGVTVGGPGLVAVGFRYSLSSVDGITWSRVPSGNHDRSSVITIGTGLVAVGAVDDAALGASDSDAAVSTSVDGITWSMVSHDGTTGLPG